MKCEICSCEPYADVAWSGNCATFCELHIKELWNKLEFLLKSNLVYFVMGPVGTLSGFRIVKPQNKSKVCAYVHPLYPEKYELEDGEKYNNGLYQISNRLKFNDFYNKYKESEYYKMKCEILWK